MAEQFGFHDELIAAAEQAEWSYAFDAAIEGLNEPGPADEASLVEYYEEFGKILAELDCGNSANNSDNCADPILQVKDNSTHGSGGAFHQDVWEELPDLSMSDSGIEGAMFEAPPELGRVSSGKNAETADPVPYESETTEDNQRPWYDLPDFTAWDSIIDAAMNGAPEVEQSGNDPSQYSTSPIISLESEYGTNEVPQNTDEYVIESGEQVEAETIQPDPVQYGGGTIHEDRLFTVLRKSERFYKKFCCQGVYYVLDIPKPSPKMNPERWLTELLNGIIQYFKDDSSLDVRSGDRIGMSLRNSVCDTEPIYISLRRADQLSADVVLDHVMRIFDSNKEFFLNGHLGIQFDHIQMPHGSGNTRVRREFGETSTEFIWKKACFLKYTLLNNSRDEYCLPYALVMARANVQRKKGEITNKEYRRYQTSEINLKRAAANLCREAGVNMTAIRGGCSFDEVKKFQSILPTYQIVIYRGLDMNTRPYTDSRFFSTAKLNIMLHNNHYMAMRSVSACFALSYVCPDCHTQANTRTAHTCKYACSFCESKPRCTPCHDEDMITCPECNRTFLGETCYKNHLTLKGTETVTLCNFRKKCIECKAGYSRKNSHHCNRHYCKVCQEIVPNAHQCYKTKYSDDQNILYIYYDFETQQDTPLSETEPNKFLHVPNLCVLQTSCSGCSANDDVSVRCKVCSFREKIFDSFTCVEELMAYITRKSNEKTSKVIDGKTRKVYRFDKIIAIAHNMSGFDGQFILKYIYESDRFPKPSLIINGTKIINISLGSRVRFVDSLNYILEPLSALPGLFGFEGSKGYYPHLFNTRENENYVGPIPPKKFYSPDTMSVKGQAEFDAWYNSIPTDYVFDNKKELIEYCRQDVNILRKACIKFATDFWECNQISPFVDGTTIAGACNRVFRSKFLEKDTIGIMPTRGYRFVENQSKIALKWLCLLEMELDIVIQHAGRGREINIPGVGRCDGMFGNTVLEFDGCYYHFCDTCYPKQFDANDKSEQASEMRFRREKTIEKHRAIRAAGYNLIVMKECDFRRKLKNDPTLELKLENHPIIASEPLNPRDAFYGGRTNANTLYAESDENTKIYYYDICSLYPYINKTAKTPVKHGKVHVGDDCLKVPWQQLDGLMKVTVLPPRGLGFPVLPTRMHSKLIFVLCAACGQSLSKQRCKHTDAERQFTGVYVIDEVKLAISKGYQVIKIHEIWEYEVTQYDPKTRTGGLFAGYIDNFLKIKTEASGYPESCETVEQKQAYIKEFYEREGILLDESKIVRNPALRQLAKIQLNSFWGRFGMRPDLFKTTLIQCYDELLSKMFDPSIEIHSILPINDDNMLLTYKDLEEARVPDKTTSVVIAAFTTAYARMELYKYLDMLGPERVLYFDTDSIIFKARPGDAMPLKGDFLGQMTDELKGGYILKYISGGAKNYAYIAFFPKTGEFKTVVKVKGITLNYKNSKEINFDVIKNMVIGPDPNSNDKKIDSVKVENNCIRRTNLAEVYTTKVPKTYRFTYTKRQILENGYETIPYGF